MFSAPFELVAAPDYVLVIGYPELKVSLQLIRAKLLYI